MRLYHFAVAACLVAAVPARAQRMEGGWHHDGMEMLHGLNLTDAQQQQVHAIAQAAELRARPAMEQMRGLHEQMTSALLSGATVAQIAPVVRQEEALRDQLDSDRLEVAVRIRGLLTSAQLAAAGAQHVKLAALHAQEHAVMSGQ